MPSGKCDRNISFLKILPQCGLLSGWKYLVLLLHGTPLPHIIGELICRSETVILLKQLGASLPPLRTPNVSCGTTNPEPEYFLSSFFYPIFLHPPIPPSLFPPLLPTSFTSFFLSFILPFLPRSLPPSCYPFFLPFLLPFFSQINRFPTPSLMRAAMPS